MKSRFGIEIPSPSEWDQNAQFILAALCIACTMLLITGVARKRRGLRKLRLPPGPRGVPMLGSLPYLQGPEHQALHRLSERYGPLMFMHLGSLPTLVVSNAKMAKEVLKTNDQSFASRPTQILATQLLYNQQDVGFSPYGSHWRLVRKISTLKLFTINRINYFQDTRQSEVLAMVHSILHESEAGKLVQVNDFLGDLTLNIITQLMWNKRHRTAREGKVNSSAVGKNDMNMDIVREVFDLIGANNMADFVPIVGKLFMKLQGLDKRMVDVHKKFDSFLEKILNGHRERLLSLNAEDLAPKDADNLVDVLLKLSMRSTSDEYISPETIKGILTGLIIGGADTTSVTLEWALAELVRNPAMMSRAQEELNSVVSQDRLVKEEDVPNLTYLNAVVKETLRLHPPGPLGIPHSSIADCEIDGLHVPAGSLVLINIWAIQRDPAEWENPLEFDPERFLDNGKSSGLDLRGQDYKLIPFSSGRRSCAGINLALAVLPLALAQLLHCIEWTLPGDQKPKDLDMTEATSFNNNKNVPLILSPKPRLPHHVTFPQSS